MCTKAPVRWGRETTDRIARAYDHSVGAYSAKLPPWADLPIETRLVLAAVYCAGRIDGGHE